MSYDDQSTASALELDNRDRIRSFETSQLIIICNYSNCIAVLTDRSGDPTVFGNLPKSPAVTAALCEALESGKYDGYPHSCGYPETRAAVAQQYSVQNRHGAVQYKSEDVVVTSGCSHALEMCLGVLANEGDNVLIPVPGFSLYQTLLDSKGTCARVTV
jgi:aspartate/methionine/tyrosine aminotransferase